MSPHRRQRRKRRGEEGSGRVNSDPWAPSLPSFTSVSFAFTLIELLVVIAISAPEPVDPSQYRLRSYPGSYHNGAGNFSYADGHTEAHKWIDPRTRPPLVKDLRLPMLDPENGFPSPGNPDVRWLQERTFQRGD